MIDLLFILNLPYLWICLRISNFGHISMLILFKNNIDKPHKRNLAINDFLDRNFSFIVLYLSDLIAKNYLLWARGCFIITYMALHLMAIWSNELIFLRRNFRANFQKRILFEYFCRRRFFVVFLHAEFFEDFVFLKTLKIIEHHRFLSLPLT